MESEKATVKKSVLITGCSSGIGFATAVQLAGAGFTVFATVRKEPDAERIRCLGISDLIPVCPLDLSRPVDIGPVVRAVQAEIQRRGHPGLFALINNAGGGSVSPIELMDIDVFLAELKTRLVGAVSLVQAVLPLLREGAGRIVWIMTPAAIPTPYVTSIHACDFAVNCISRTLGIELKPWRIPCVQVRCGGIQTDKGLQTTSEVEAILQHPKADLYRSRLEKWSKEMAVFDKKRTEPVEVARVVQKALCARRPKQRYSIGYMSGIAGFLESLPQPLTDFLLKAHT